MHLRSKDTQEAPEAGKRLEWVEPEIVELDVRETELYPTVGGDGCSRHGIGGAGDCSRS